MIDLSIIFPPISIIKYLSTMRIKLFRSNFRDLSNLDYLDVKSPFINQVLKGVSNYLLPFTRYYRQTRKVYK